MKYPKFIFVPTLPAALLLLNFCLPVSAAAEYQANYVYSLSDFSGTKPFSGARLALDTAKKEIYAMTGETVSVFNASGMEVYRFDYDPTIGVVSDVLATSDQKLVLLARKGPRTRLVLCNFRVEPLGEIELTGFPEELQGFGPDRIFARNGRFYLVNSSAMKVVVTNEQGTFISSRDLGQEAGMTEKEIRESGIGGITLGRDGSFIFSIPAMAKLFVVAPDGTAKVFGKRGSATGRFGVITGVAEDRDGNILVVDKLRTVVMVFDRKFALLKEFGRRGLRPGEFIAPDDILVDPDNKVYISNLRKQGIVVFQLSSD